MRKNKGMSPIIIIAIVAVIAIAGFLMFSKGSGGSTPEAIVLNAVKDLKTEYYNTNNDFMPGFDFEKMAEKGLKEGNVSVDMDFNFTPPQDMGMDKAGVTLQIKQVPKEKKAFIDFALKMGNVEAINLNLSTIENEVYVYVPMLYDKALMVNTATMGEDIKTSALATKYGIDASILEGVKIDLTAVPMTFDGLQKDFVAFAKPEIDALKEGIEISEPEEMDTKVIDAMKSVKEVADVKQYDVVIKSESVKPLLVKALEYSIDLQKRQISGIPELEELSNMEELKSKIEAIEMPESVMIKTFVSNKKLVGLSADIEEGMSVRFYFLGDKNTTDNVVAKFVQGETEVGNMTMTLDKNVMTASFNAEGLGELATMNWTYSPDSHDTNLVVSAMGEDMMTLKGKINNAEGLGYEFIVEEGIVNDPYMGEELKFDGSYKVSLDSVEISAPENSVEILKADEAQLEEIQKAVMTNIQKLQGLASLAGAF